MKGLKRIKSIKWLTNLYVVIGAFLWFGCFFDSNSVLIQWQLRKEIRALEQEKNYLEKEIEADLLLLKNSETPQRKSDTLENSIYLNATMKNYISLSMQTALNLLNSERLLTI